MGIYSLMAFLTAQRTQEIGVRMALGAGRWQVVRAITSRALVITAIGAGVGAALAFGLGRADGVDALWAGDASTCSQLAGLVAVLGRGGAAGRVPAGPPRRAVSIR